MAVSQMTETYGESAGMTTDVVPVMQQLRDDTHDLHMLAERQALQLALMRGHLPQAVFVSYLAQLFIIHQRFEPYLAAMADVLPPVARAVQPYHYHAARLQRDLHFFGSLVSAIEPLPATERFLQQLDDYRRHEPVALMGVHYVLEGSKNGGRFQAMVARDIYHLPAGQGTEYLDPYGEQLQALWSKYKADVNSTALTPEARAAMVAGAKQTFLTFVGMCQELMERGNHDTNRHC